MPDQPLVNPTALEPLFSPWEEPIKHRIRADKPGEPARILNGRRPSPLVIANNLRWAVKEWRESFYGGASDTTRELLNHWFNRSHRGKTAAGEEFEFHYYFCQREAIETLTYLKEVRGLTCLSQIVAEFGGPAAEVQSLGITEEEDMWSRYAFKVATGAGKTKIMSLAMVWSYFHHLRESDSPLTRHFVVVAPNLTVYERLKEDFGDGRIFDTDPLIPAEWRGDWNLSVVLQDETKGREDRDVPRKARAAVEWCRCASARQCRWEYLYVPQDVFEGLREASVEALARTCTPALQNLLKEEEHKDQLPLFASVIEEEAKETPFEAKGLVDKEILDALPERYRRAAEQAISVFRFLEKKENINYAQVFQALLGSVDEACRGLILKRLLPRMPDPRQEQRAWFNPYVDNLGRAQAQHYLAIAQNLKKTLVYRNGFSPLGLLRNCLDYALNDSTKITGVFEALKTAFKVKGAADLLTVVANINEFRNTYVAHQEKELRDVNLARKQLTKWVAGLCYVHMRE